MMYRYYKTEQQEIYTDLLKYNFDYDNFRTFK